MSDTSRIAVLDAYDRPFELRSFPVPEPEPGGATVRVAYGGICGTDIHLQEGRLPIPCPVGFGHEGVGRLDRAGDGVTSDALGRSLSPGDMVLWASNIPCGRCRYCVLHGERTLCVDRRVYGINQSTADWPHLSGSWSDRMVLRPGSTIIRLPDGVQALDAISLGCAGPTAVHGFERLPAPGELGTVVVQGAGPVGLASAMLARLHGAERVVLVGGPTDRVTLARRLGIGDEHVDLTEIPDADDREEHVRSLVGGDGADTVIECAGVPAAVAETFALARPNGQCLVLGQYTDRGPTSLNPHLITKKQLRVAGSWAFAERHYVGYVRALTGLLESVPLRELVTVFALEDVNDAAEAVRSGTVTKAALAPDGS